MKTHTIVFDLDDTLYLERDYVLSGFAAVHDWLVKEHQWDGFIDHATGLFQAGHRGRIFNEALADSPLPDDSDLVARMIAIYRDHIPKISLLAEADLTLAWAGRSFRTAIVSDGFLGVQQRKIDALGLEARVPLIVLTDAFGRTFWKPNPKAFQTVMQAMPGEAAGYVYVADNPRKDFLGPRGLGWRTVRIRRLGGEHVAYEPTPAEAADHEIGSLLELKRLLG
jgi:putative hydrolase of the HAD superfamily